MCVTRSVRKIISFGVCFVIGAVLLTACSSSTSGKQSGSSNVSQNNTITMGALGGPSSLDPQTGDSGADYQYLWFIFARLINFNSNTGALEPGLATSWTWKGTNKTELLLNLRQGVKFQDGTPFNAAAVVYNLNRYMSKGDVINNLEYYKDSKAIGTYQVAIYLTQPNAQIPYGLADRAGMMISPTAARNDAAKGVSFATNPVGAGPYEFVSQVADESYDFRSFSNYYDNAAFPHRVENIKFSIFKTQTAMATALESNDIQVATGVSPTVLSSIKADKNLVVKSGPNMAETLIQFDGALAPFNSAKIRLAFNLALNLKAITNSVTNGLGSPLYELAPKGTVGYIANQIPLWKQNITKAKSLVKQAGYSNGVSFSCYTYPGLGWSIAGPIVEAEEAAVGIHIHLITGTPAEVGPFYEGKEGPCYASGFLATANPVQITQSLLWQPSYYNAGKTNFGVNSYIESFLTTYTSKGEANLFQKIWAVEKTDPGYAPLFTQPDINVYDSNIKGYVVSPIEQDNWMGMYYS